MMICTFLDSIGKIQYLPVGTTTSNNTLVKIIFILSRAVDPHSYFADQVTIIANFLAFFLLLFSNFSPGSGKCMRIRIHRPALKRIRTLSTHFRKEKHILAGNFPCQK